MEPRNICQTEASTYTKPMPTINHCLLNDILAISTCYLVVTSWYYIPAREVPIRSHTVGKATTSWTSLKGENINCLLIIQHFFFHIYIWKSKIYRPHLVYLPHFMCSSFKLEQSNSVETCSVNISIFTTQILNIFWSFKSIKINNVYMTADMQKR